MSHQELVNDWDLENSTRNLSSSSDFHSKIALGTKAIIGLLERQNKILERLADSVVAMAFGNLKDTEPEVWQKILERLKRE